MLDHVGEIDFVHRRHPAARMPRAEIALEQLELFAGRPRAAFDRDQPGIALEVAALGGGRLEFARRDPHRHAGPAIRAARAVGNRLAAAEPDPAERIIQ
jgi:hypothetical protein